MAFYDGKGNVISSSGFDSKDTTGIESAYTDYQLLKDRADSYAETGFNNMVRFTISNVSAGDIINTVRAWNGQSGIFSDGSTSYDSYVKWSNYLYGTWTAPKDFATLYVQCTLAAIDSACILHRPEGMDSRPAYYDEFIPTIADEEDSAVKVLSSEKIFDMIGGSEKRAKQELAGKVWIAMGDSFTVGMKTQFENLAAKYGMVVDNRGIVSSSICGDYDSSTGEGRGFKPMWKRTKELLTQYTEGYTLNDVTYTIEDVGLITFMGGANDAFSKSKWLGEYGTATMDTYYIYGALNSIFNDFLTGFPNAKVIVITQPGYFNQTIDSTVTDEIAQLWGFKDSAAYQSMTHVQFANYGMDKKQEAVREMAKVYHLHVVDANRAFPNVFYEKNQTTYWTPDKLHLTGEGYQFVADMLDEDGIRKVFN